MTIWAISDLHLWHENILKWGRGQFKDVDDMSRHIAERWNAVVQPGDKVYVLGDCFFGGRPITEWHQFMKQLKGKKRLILGNHDDPIKIVQSGVFQKISLWRHFHEENLLLTHVPLHESCLVERCGEHALNVHGHTHLHGSPAGNYFSVCCELVDFTPVDISTIRKRWEDKQ